MTATIYEIMCDCCEQGTRNPVDIGGQQWCPSCVEGYAGRCESCGEMLPTEDLRRRESDDALCCDECLSSLPE